MDIKLFEREEKRALKVIKGIVLHWPGGNVTTLSGLWEWMNASSENSYHYLVSNYEVIQTREIYLRALHCGHRTYTSFARDFFGNRVCSSNDSPNNYTIGVCILHDHDDGTYDQSTLDTASALLNKLCKEYHLEPEKQIIRHSDITDEKSEPCPKGFFKQHVQYDNCFFGHSNDFFQYFKENVLIHATRGYKRREIED